MSWTQKELDTCQEAFYLLRQDVDVPTPETADADATLEWRKCAKAFVRAREEILCAHDWTFARAAGQRADLSRWPEGVRNALVYCLARELAIPLAGRVADMQNFDALYRDKLRQAIVRDLEDETAGDATAQEVLAAIRAYYADDSRLPMSIAKLAEKVAAVEDSALDEILAAHAWESDVTGGYGVIYNALKEV